MRPKPDFPSDLFTDWYWEQDAELRFTRFEGRMAELTGQRPTEAIGLRRWELSGIAPLSCTWEEHRAALDAHAPFRDFEYSRLQADGQLHYVSCSGDPVFDARGRFTGYRGVSSDITKRKRAEDALRLAELNYRSIFDNAVEGMYRVDERGKVVMANQALARMLGHASPEAMMSSIADVAREVYVEPEDRRRYRELLKEHGVISGFETRWRRVDGSVIWVSISGRMVRDPAGGRYHLGSAIDITERKREERLLALEHSVARLLAEARDEDEGLEAVLAAVARSEGWECARYFEVDDAAGAIRLRHTWHDGSPQMRAFSEGSRALEFRKGQGLTGHVWETGEALWVPDVSREPRVAMRALAARAGVHGALVVPVKFEGKVVGALSISSPSIRQPDERLSQALGMVCGQIGQFHQRKRAEEEQRASRQLLDNIVDNIPTAVQLKSVRDGYRIVLWNKAAETMYGLPREEAIGRSVHDLWPARDAAAMHAADEALVRTGGMHDFPDRLALTRHRGTIHVHMRKVALLDAEGAVSHLLVVADDVSARLRAEERRAKHIRYQELLTRFSESALGRRAAAELFEDAVATVHEALGGAVAYVRRTAADAGLGLEVAAVAGASPGPLPAFPAFPALSAALESGALQVLDAPERILPAALAAGHPCGLLMPASGDARADGALCVLAASAGALAQEECRFLEAAASVLSAGLRRIESEGRLAFLAQFDALTGLPNRALLSDRFSQMIVQAKRHASLLGVLFIDLDHFKHVNDTLGHAGGDALLVEVARRVQACVRSGDTVARISGDEFAVLLGDLARAEDAALVAQKILDRLAEPIEVAGTEIFVSASIGIAAFPADGAEAESLLRAADAAMYRAKQAGRNAYQFFTPEIDQRTRARAQLGSDLRRALERQEFELAYQPKLDLRTGLVSGAEALLRWRRPDGTMVEPSQFIPVLEETGLIVQVGEWVLRRACFDLKRWQNAGLRPVPVSVNCSARQFRQQDLDARVRALIDAAALDPRLLELEITESQLMQDPQHAVRVVKALHDHGVRIAIDDFGTGYSSLSYLTRFPVSALKIDRSFVANALGDPAAAAIVRTIIDMAHTLGFIVVAEGVETEGQAAFLRGLGCEQAQGFLFARPMPAADFAALLGSFPE